MISLVIFQVQVPQHQQKVQAPALEQQALIQAPQHQQEVQAPALEQQALIQVPQHQQEVQLQTVILEYI